MKGRELGRRIAHGLATGFFRDPKAVEDAAERRQRRVHPIVRVTYVPRVFAFLAGSLTVASTLTGRPPWLAVVMVAAGIAWPQVAHLLCLRSSDTRGAGFLALRLDGIYIGLMVSLTGFSLLPSGIFLANGASFLLMMGGFGLVLRGFPFLALGLTLGLPFVGFDPQPASPTTVALVVAHVSLVFLATAWAVLNSTLDLAALRHELKRAMSEISSIAEVSRTVNSTLDEQKVLQSIFQALSSLFAFDQMGVLRLDDRGESLVFDAALGTGLPEGLLRKLKAQRFAPPSGSLFNNVVRQRQTAYVSRIWPDLEGEMESADQEFYRLNPVRALLAVPLVVGDEVLGVIFFCNSREPFSLSGQDIETIERYVAHLSMALRNSRLFEIAERARAAADSASEAKSAFLANMSHELRTPLNGILGYVQLLQRDRGLSPEQRERLDGIGRSGTHLLGLINEVLDLSKIESGRLEIDLAPTRLRELVRNTEEMILPRALNKGLTFECVVEPEVPGAVLTDGPKLSQVLINLLGNAVKFTSRGTVRLVVRTPSPAILEFEVEDTGAGIAREHLADIFDPFRQAEAGRVSGGTGLGLGISRRLTNLLGGELRVESELGRGSRFVVSIPYDESEANRIEEGSPLSASRSPELQLERGREVTVLVADDNEINRDVLAGLLRTAGFRTAEAADGEETLKRIDESDPDLVLLDIIMPEVDGREVVRRLRADPKHRDRIVIAVSASVFKGERQRAMEAGFDDFIAKPVEAIELYRKIERHLGIRYCEDAKPAGARGRDTAGSSRSIAPLPPDQARSIAAIVRSALDEGDFDAVEELGAGLRTGRHPDWGERIVQPAREFDFDALERVVADLEAAAGEPSLEGPAK